MLLVLISLPGPLTKSCYCLTLDFTLCTFVLIVAEGLLQLFRQSLEHSLYFLMDLPGLKPLPPVRVLAVGWGSCLTDVTDLTNLQLAISSAVAAIGGALTYTLTLILTLISTQNPPPPHPLTQTPNPNPPQPQPQPQPPTPTPTPVLTLAQALALTLTPT